MWSSSRPGVATTTSDAGPQRLLLRAHRPPPTTSADRTACAVASPRQTSSICWASSRVGETTSARVGAAGQVEEPVQDRQQERGRLAGAGLGGGDHVAAGEDGGDRPGLNRRRLGVLRVRGWRRTSAGCRPRDLNGMATPRGGLAEAGRSAVLVELPYVWRTDQTTAVLAASHCHEPVHRQNTSESQLG